MEDAQAHGCLTARAISPGIFSATIALCLGPDLGVATMHAAPAEVGVDVSRMAALRALLGEAVLLPRANQLCLGKGHDSYFTSACSTAAQSADACTSCFGVLQTGRKSEGAQTTMATQRAREVATFSRFKL
jgi:hypothetical protein